MQTGEGKTMSAVPAAVFRGVLGRGVHVATPNAYLAHRDYHELRDVYEALGLTVGYLDTNPAQAKSKAALYQCDVTYGPGYEFGFDYLRDQMTFVSADDWLFTTYAPWFSNSLRWLSKQSNNNIDYDSKIRKNQTSIEQEQFGHRLQMLQQMKNVTR